MVKRIIGSILVERRLAGESPNWTEILGSVASTINSQHGRGSNDVSAFEAVFGQEYDHKLSCSKEEARKCWTISDHMGVTSDQDFKNYAVNNFIVDDDGSDVDIEDDDYFSEDELVAEEMGEVSDAVFDELLFHEDFIKPNQDYSGRNDSADKPPYPTANKSTLMTRDFSSDSDLHLKLPDSPVLFHDDFINSNQDLKSPASPVLFHDDFIKSNQDYAGSNDYADEPPYPTANKSTLMTLDFSSDSDLHLKSPDSPVINISDKSQLKTPESPSVIKIINATTSRCPLPFMSVADAWVHQEMLTKRPPGVTDVLVARLQCNKCFGSGSSDPSIIIGSQKYHDNIALTSAWFEFGFIHGFATLLNHDAHTSVMPYTKGTTIVRLVNCHHPNETITEILGYGSSTTHLVSVVYNKSHFVVLYYDLGAKTVVVFDGLRFKIETWIKHIVFTVKRYGLVPLAANYAAVPSQDCVDVVLDTSTRSSQKRTAVSKQTVISFEGHRNPWIVGHDTSYQQIDGHNCGPIACIKLMEIFGAREPGTIHEIGTDPKHLDETYRTLVMNYYESRLKLYDSILKVQFRPLKKMKVQ
jgi:hypothetical protein